MLLRPRSYLKRLKIYVHPPTDNIPRLADMAEFGWARTSVAIRSNKPGPADLASGVGKNHVTRTDNAKEIIKAITRAILLTLGGPNVATFELVVKSLLMVYPPVAHESRVVD
jgi:hypothetical protein